MQFELSRQIVGEDQQVISLNCHFLQLYFTLYYCYICFMATSVLCIGATLVDELYFCDATIVPHSSNPAHKKSSIGGVMGNIAQNLATLNTTPALITAIGNDAEGSYILHELTQKGINSAAFCITPESTGKYVSVLQPDGNLFVAVCQDNGKRYLSVAYMQSKSDYIKGYDMLIIDTNLDTDVIQWFIHFAKQHQKMLIIEPVSVTKALQLAALDLDGVYLITPNEAELQAISSTSSSDTATLVTSLLKRGVQNIWLRQGERGSTWFSPSSTLHLAVPKITIVDSTGAGDAALAGWVLGKVQKDTPLNCLKLGHSLALHILQQKGTVDVTMSATNLYDLMKTYYHD